MYRMYKEWNFPRDFVHSGRGGKFNGHGKRVTQSVSGWGTLRVSDRPLCLFSYRLLSSHNLCDSNPFRFPHPRLSDGIGMNPIPPNFFEGSSPLLFPLRTPIWFEFSSSSFIQRSSPSPPLQPFVHVSRSPYLT